MREIRSLRLMRRGLETWNGRDTVALADERASNSEHKLRPTPARQSSTLLPRRARRTRSALRIRKGKPGHPPGTGHVPTARSLCERLLRLASSANLSARPAGRVADRADSRHPPLLARELRSSAHPRRARPGAPHLHRSQARGAADALGGVARDLSPTLRANHDTGETGNFASRFGRAALSRP